MNRTCAIFFRLDTAPAVRLWAGAGRFRVPADIIETDSRAHYLGAGQLIGLPTVQSLINGTEERVTFSLSGAAVNAEAARLADDEADQIRGVDCHIGVRRYSNLDQPTGPTIWVWHGIADSISIAQAPAMMGQVERGIGLSVAGLFTFRQRPKPAYFTNVDQRRRSSTDSFCDNVATLSMDTTKVWRVT
jgi:hypothetical protein